MGRTSIEWTDYSWPIVNGCRRVSAGCERCYAERLTATRLSKTLKYKGLAVFGKNGPKWTGETRLWEPHLEAPLNVKKPGRWFVADMGDLFYEGVADEDIARVFVIMALAKQHTFQILTKRPERMRAWMTNANGERICQLKPRSGHGDWIAVDTLSGFQWPLPNVWLGVSVEDQATADERIPILLETPAAVRFVSYEPALGPLTLHPGILGSPGHLAETFGNPLIHWLICGGESGPGARPFDLNWARSIVGQCNEADVACFVKQLGARPFDGDEGQRCDGEPHEWAWLKLKDRKGGDIEEFPDDLRVRQFPEPRA